MGKVIERVCIFIILYWNGGGEGWLHTAIHSLSCVSDFRSNLSLLSLHLQGIWDTMTGASQWLWLFNKPWNMFLCSIHKKCVMLWFSFSLCVLLLHCSVSFCVYSGFFSVYLSSAYWRCLFIIHVFVVDE